MIFRTLTISILALGLMACGGASDESAASLNEDTLQVTFVENLNCEEGLQANPGTMIGDGGGAGMKFNSGLNLGGRMIGDGGGTHAPKMAALFSTDAQTCQGYTWEVSGECTNCNDLLVEVGDDSAVISVGENGEFNFTMQTTSIEAPLLLTPMYEGVLGIQSYADLLLDL